MAMSKKSKKSKKKPASKAKPKKAAPKKKVMVRAKTKTTSKPKKASAAKPASKPRKKGLSVAELFALKKQKEQAAAQGPEGWKKEHAAQGPAPAENLHDKFESEGKKSGFGGTRHH